MHRKSLIAITVLLLYYPTLYAEDYIDCLELTNHYGPYDYTNPNHVRYKLPIVEKAHFNKRVANLIGGAKRSGSLVEDFDYTLRAFPNHHGALTAVAKYSLKNKMKQANMYYAAECYFDRAITFKPDDGVLYLIYGTYYHKGKKYKKAVEQYMLALKLLKKSAELNYNLGLVMYELKNINESYKYAKIAYKLGYPLPALKNKLKKKGVWKESNEK